MARASDELKAEPALEEARATLYAAPLEEFVALRGRLVADLRARGEKELAKSVLALRKPNVPAWGLNQLVRQKPERLDELYEARAEAERVQSRGAAGEMRAAIVRYRSLLEQLVLWVKTCLEDAGHAPTKEQLRSLREALDVASHDRERARADLEAGSLVRALGADDTEVAGLPASISHARPAPKVTPKRDPVVDAPSAVELATRRLKEQAQRRLAEAEVLLRDAEARETRARAELRAAEQSLETASREVDAARATVDAARSAMAPFE
jgi:hypothetical protein